MNTCLIPLSNSELQKYELLVDKASCKIQDKVKRTKKKYFQKQVKKLVKTGVAKIKATEIITSRMDCILLPDDILLFDKGEKISVKDVLSNLSYYNEKTLSDPLEPELGANKAILYANIDTGKPIIHSFNHGGVNYSFGLTYDTFQRIHASGMVKGKHRVARKENFQLTFSTNADLIKHYAGETIINHDGKLINIAKHWCNNPNRQQFNGVECIPISGMLRSPDIIINDNGILNLYTGMATKPIKGDYKLILKHIRYIWCNNKKNQYQYTINWLARMLQYPADRAHTSLVLRSDQGAGKGIITDIFDRAFGYHGATLANGEQISGKFNALLANCVFVCANEATTEGKKKDEGILKSLITDETLTLEFKGVDAFIVRNSTHIIVATNNVWSVPQAIDDRRFVSYDVSAAKIGDREYFDALRNEINNGGAEAFIYYLLKHDITNFRPQDRPIIFSRTERDNKLNSANTVVQWFDHITEAGMIDCQSTDKPLHQLTALLILKSLIGQSL